MKVRCISVLRCSSLISGGVYTVKFEKTNSQGEEFYCLNEIDRGSNLYFTWRFEKLIGKLNSNVKVL